jgi:death-on-curing protein
MPELLQQIFYYPSPHEVEDLHSAIIAQRGTRGWMSKGMVKGCLEWASTYVFNTMPFPTFLLQGSALMYGFITFHPFTDGNKRTALMTTAFFFFLNGHTLLIGSDAPEFTKSIAERCLDS